MPRARTLEERIDEIRPDTVAFARSGRPPLRRFWGVLPVLAIAGLLALRACLHTPPLANLAAVDDGRAGFLAIARGGPVVVGFQSEAPARLAVGGLVAAPPPLDMLRAGMPLDEARHHPPFGTARARGDRTLVVDATRELAVVVEHDGKTITSLGVDLHGAGLQRARVIAQHGSVPIRFSGGPDARLVWNPVGRRGDPEYVPASSLSPDGTFDAPGTALLDGVIALAILAVVVATLCMLARRRLAAVSRHTWIAMAAVLVVALAVRIAGIGDHGQTWDEDTNWGAGKNYVTNVLALDFADRSWVWNYEHPPVMKLLDGIGAQLADGFGPARLLSALWLALGCALLVPIGTRLFRFRAGVLAGGIAALLPALVAHGQIVGHESPTVLWWALGIVLALGVHDYLPADDRRALRALQIRLAWIGVVIGVAVASRFVNGLLGPLCALIVVVQAPPRWRVATITWGAAVMPIVAIATVYAIWPRLWAHPFANLDAALAKLKGLHDEEPFLGAMTRTPGPHYFLLYLGATAPIGVLAGVAAWVGRSVASWQRARPAAPRRANAIVLAWLAIPLVGVMLSPVRQDGVRYVMPCVLALAVMAAAGVDYLATLVEKRARHAFLALAAAMIGYLGITAYRTAPYYLDYFGEHTGGAGAVAAGKTFETAWWGEGLDRAIAYVNEHAAPGDRVLTPSACIAPYHMAWFREDLWTEMTANPAQATWIVSYAPATRRCPLPADARDVFEVVHDGVVLAAVYRR